MKSLNLLYSAVLLFIVTAANAQDLVIRIDDMGSSHSANAASIDCYRNGIATAVEVMPVCAWFPEAVKMLQENPGLDVGVHLAITSEWENVKWGPLTDCPSLTDENGWFYPMLSPNPAYPGQSILEHKDGLDMKEIEREFRAQIEMAQNNIPQVTHITGHMGSTSFTPEVVSMIQKLSEEYHLPVIDRADAAEAYDFQFVGYDGPHATSEEKIASFLKTLDKLEKGKRYVFLDHPAYNDSEMATAFHIGYENVAIDRQGVTDLLTSPAVKKAIEEKGIRLIDFNYLTKQMPRADTPAKLDKAVDKYLAAVQKAGQDLHSLMIVKDGNVVYEEWMSTGNEFVPHTLFSVSKTFTSSAVGLAISEGKLRLDDKVISYFPDDLPEEVNENLAAMTIRDLLTMNCGHETEPSVFKNRDMTWEQSFLAHPVNRKPGTIFCYNSYSTYMLSAIVQKVTGQKVRDYLFPRLFRPLGINNVRWGESPAGVNLGGWGLSLKTEDLAKMGQMILQGGQWNGTQVLPAEWVKEMSAAQVPCVPAGKNSDELPSMMKDIKKSDWIQGYGYQMWRSRHNAFRADGAQGQFIIIIPDKNAVIVTTAKIDDMQAEIDLIWKYLLPAL